MNSKKITVEKIRAMKIRGEKIAALTAYDFPTAKLLDEIGIPFLLVGDSLGMVTLGYPDTTHVTMAEMEHHVRAVARAKPNALLGADLPFASYKTISDAVANAKKIISAGAEFVKAEGGAEILPQVRAILKNGIPFCGHLGMLPHAAGRQRNFRKNFRADDWHRQRRGLRRPNFGDAGFNRHVSVVHTKICETKNKLRSRNKIGSDGVEKFARAKLTKTFRRRECLLI
jgi:3-methyl-2-oxobutanoate hydroxymethyltransferase